MDHLASLPLRPELSLHLLARLAWSMLDIPVRLDETLLALSIVLVQKQMPIHKFPAAMLKLLHRPKNVPHVYVDPVSNGSVWRPGPSRCKQFLFEVERIMAIELVVRAAAHRLPTELVEMIVFFANPHKLPLFRNLKDVWVPWPRVLRESSYSQYGTKFWQKPGDLDCTVRWSATTRRFEQLSDS